MEDFEEMWGDRMPIPIYVPVNEPVEILPPELLVPPPASGPFPPPGVELFPPPGEPYGLFSPAPSYSSPVVASAPLRPQSMSAQTSPGAYEEPDALRRFDDDPHQRYRAYFYPHADKAKRSPTTPRTLKAKSKVAQQKRQEKPRLKPQQRPQLS